MWLGVSLFYVGAVLCLNGLWMRGHIADREIWVMNLFSGLVSLATREEHVAGALSRLPEVMTRGVRSANQLGDLLAAASVLVLGPGLGQQAWGRSLLSAA